LAIWREEQPVDGTGVSRSYDQLGLRLRARGGGAEGGDVDASHNSVCFKKNRRRNKSSCPAALVCKLVLIAWGGRNGSLSRRCFAGVHVIPIVDGVEGEEVSSLRLPAPEGAQREEDDMALAERDIDCERAIG
jgi:hypothetical protein